MLLPEAALNVHSRDVAGKYPNLKINACCPGLVDTELGRPVKSKVDQMDIMTEQIKMKTVGEAAKVPVFLMMQDISSSGQYFGTLGLEIQKC